MTHRFINVDGYVSTGTGILGHNMFAYCNNNPVKYSDFYGEKIYPAGFIGPIQQGDYRIGEPYANTICNTNTRTTYSTTNSAINEYNDYEKYNNFALGLTGFRGTVYTLAGKYTSEVSTSVFLGIYGTLITVPMSNYAHRSNPYLTTRQQNNLCYMEWGFAIASVAVPLFISNCWNPLGWTAGAITLIGLGITTIGVVTISYTETYYMENNKRKGYAGNWS